MSCLRINVTVDRMKQARASLGSTGALDEALVATGIDALFTLLDGGAVEIEGRTLRLIDPADVDLEAGIRAWYDIITNFAGDYPELRMVAAQAFLDAVIGKENNDV